MIRKVLLIFTLTLACNFSQASTNDNSSQALAFCWQSKDHEWWCDGPLQILWAPQKKLEKALKKVGCIEYKSSHAWAGNSRVGHIFYCKKNLSDYDRDIRERYGL